MIFRPQLPKIDTSEILDSFTIYPSLKDIGEIVLKISHQQGQFCYIMTTSDLDI